MIKVMFKMPVNFIFIYNVWR